ncbi:MAG: L-threonylcarbamoyladenylate synthase, partial [Verrucomicrobiia bacterium]
MDLEPALRLLRQGLPIAVPTETVYGLAADGLNPEAVARIFAIKQRPHFDPLILHIADPADLPSLAAVIPPDALTLAHAFWPGGLTLLLPKQPIVPDLVTAGLPTVAIRCPAHPIMRQLLHQFRRPLAAPSANRFGRITPTDADAVRAELGDLIPLILDGGPCPIGIESTIIDTTVRPCRLLRAGAIPLEAIRRIKIPTRDHTELMFQAVGIPVEIEQKADGTHITVTGKPSQQYQDRDFYVPADPSSAAFPIVATLITENSQMLLKNICLNPTRTGLLVTLKEMGADISYQNQRIVQGETVADILVRSSKLHGVRVPAERAPSMIDEYPILAVAASFADGTTEMLGLHELRV